MSCKFPPPATPDERIANEFKHLIPNSAIFALGILLVELCLNNQFEEIRQASGSAASASLLDSYLTALRMLDEVYRQAGDSYGLAAERCLKFSFSGRDLYNNFSFSQFRQQFHDTVVAPVQTTYLMFPDSGTPIEE